MPSFMQSRINGQIVAVPTAAIAGGLAYTFVKSEQNVDIVEKDPVSGMPLVNVEGVKFNAATQSIARDANGGPTPTQLKGISGDAATKVAQRLPHVSQEESQRAAVERKAKLQVKAAASAEV